MNDHRSDGHEVLNIVDEGERQQLPRGLKGLLEETVSAFGGKPKNLKDWLASNEKERCIYVLCDKERVYVAYKSCGGNSFRFHRAMHGGKSSVNSE